jgi:hypothetical protein
MKYTSIEDKVKVLSLWNEGNCNKYISERLDINVRIIQRVIHENRHLPACSPMMGAKTQIRKDKEGHRSN